MKFATDFDGLYQIMIAGENHFDLTTFKLKYLSGSNAFRECGIDQYKTLVDIDTKIDCDSRYMLFCEKTFLGNNYYLKLTPRIYF